MEDELSAKKSYTKERRTLLIKNKKGINEIN